MKPVPCLIYNIVVINRLSIIFVATFKKTLCLNQTSESHPFFAGEEHTDSQQPKITRGSHLRFGKFQDVRLLALRTLGSSVFVEGDGRFWWGKLVYKKKVDCLKLNLCYCVMFIQPC